LGPLRLAILAHATIPWTIGATPAEPRTVRPLGAAIAAAVTEAAWRSRWTHPTHPVTKLVETQMAVAILVEPLEHLFWIHRWARWPVAAIGWAVATVISRPTVAFTKRRPVGPAAAAFTIVAPSIISTVVISPRLTCRFALFVVQFAVAIFVEPLENTRSVVGIAWRSTLTLVVVCPNGTYHQCQ
jgi:hypothetical protein